MSYRTEESEAPLKGDTGLLRGCLLLAGFMPEADDDIFNDAKSFGKPGRRLKLWYADQMLGCPGTARGALMRYVKKAFGDRFVRAEFTINGGMGGDAFCVWLKD